MLSFSYICVCVVSLCLHWCYARCLVSFACVCLFFHSCSASPKQCQLCVCLYVCTHVIPAQNNVSCLVCVWLRIAWASRQPTLSNRTHCPSPPKTPSTTTVVKTHCFLRKHINLLIVTCKNLISTYFQYLPFLKLWKTLHFLYLKNVQSQSCSKFPSFMFHVPPSPPPNLLISYSLTLLLLLFHLLLCRGLGGKDGAASGRNHQTLPCLHRVPPQVGTSLEWWRNWVWG